MKVFPDLDRLALAAADKLLLRASRAVRAAGRFAVALSGGSTPRRLFEVLRQRIETSRDEGVDWRRVHFFWGDERHVPPDHPESNYGAAHRAFLSVPAIPSANVHRIRAETGNAGEVAAAYEAELVRFFALGPGELPRFDLVLLGMGSDGHTASLFPGTAAVTERYRLVAAPRVEKLAASRITLTPPVFNAAAAVLFLVTGHEKAETLRRVREEPPTSELPASLIRPRDGELIWFVDRAASQISEEL